jgi:hypothetical protein
MSIATKGWKEAIMFIVIVLYVAVSIIPGVLWLVSLGHIRLVQKMWDSISRLEDKSFR